MSKPAEHPWKGAKFGKLFQSGRQKTLDDNECVLSPDYREKVKDIYGLKTRNVAALKLYEALQEKRRLEEELYDPLF